MMSYFASSWSIGKISENEKKSNLEKKENMGCKNLEGIFLLKRSSSRHRFKHRFNQ